MTNPYKPYEPPAESARRISDMLGDTRWEETKKIFDEQPVIRNGICDFLLRIAEDIERARRALGD